MDPLKILNIQTGSTLDSAKKNYRKLCLENHPDKNPNASIDTFMEIQEAYQTIVNNPGLLTSKTVNIKTYTGYIRTSMTVTLEDFYYAREKVAKVYRSVFCKTCGGSGSKHGVSGVCKHCEGKGKIKSNAMSLMGLSPECGYCKGTGVEKGERCPTCGGAKYELQEVTIKFRTTLALYYKEMAVIKGEGNQLGPNAYGDIYVKLFIKPQEDIWLEDTTFVTAARVLPVQRVIGDRQLLTLFDREIPYSIRPGAIEVEIEDHIRNTFYRTVRIKFKEIFPTQTPETEELYKKILRIEKKHLRSREANIEYDIPLGS